ncbi:hypothetical protein [Streptomyces sp. RTd22]|uniref:hypothetical protein n=1 Tax=Streptomyces sp. RTd22 TaxID=1841249 RepID=UPI0007D95483|nr:hypothetical protein [Streptomyces sp. RTd22]
MAASEFGGYGGQREAGVEGGAGGDDGERQREPSAQLDDVRHGPGLGGRPLLADPPHQRRAGVLDGRQAQEHRHGPVRGDQTGQLAAAGDEGQTAGAAGQQRTDLVMVPGVVQQDEDTPVGEQTAVQRGLRVQPGGQMLRGHAQGVQHPGDGLRGLSGRPAGVEAAQVEIQLPVGEPFGDTVRPVHRQAALPDPRHAADHDDGGGVGLRRPGGLAGAGGLRRVGGQDGVGGLARSRGLPRAGRLCRVGEPHRAAVLLRAAVLPCGGGLSRAAGLPTAGGLTRSGGLFRADRLPTGGLC